VSQTTKNGTRRGIKVPEFLKDQLAQAQVRFGQLEEGAERTLKDLLARGKASRKDLEALLVRVSADDRLGQLKGGLEKLQKTGAHQAEALRGKAENFRTEALERIVQFQGKAVKFLGVATREEIEELHRELDRLARKLDLGHKAPPARKGKKVEA
jgi:DnaJ-domain-containing protein 1